MTLEKNEKIICPTCSIQTNHKIEWKSQVKHDSDNESGIWEETRFELFTCMGCETPTLKKSYTFSEDGPEPIYEDGKIKTNKEGVEMYEYVPQVTYWPKRGTNTRKTKYFYDIPPKVNKIYREMIDAFNASMPLLCAMGVRAVIESICNEETIKGDDLKDKIESLKTKGIISEKLRNALQENRVLGNESAHDLKYFSEDTLRVAIELIESLLDFHYNSETRAFLIKQHLEKKKTPV